MQRKTAVERFALFLERLDAAPAASSQDEAFYLLVETLNRVEDEFSGVPMHPDRFLDDGRLYPPQLDNRRAVAGRDELVRYRARRHNVWVSSTGAIRIDTVATGSTAVCCLSKPGADGTIVEF